MQTLKQALLKGYTAKETACAYFVTGWFSFGAYLAYEMLVAQHLGKNYLPALFYLVLLSLVMVVTFPFFAIVWNGFDGVEALIRHDYLQALLSFGLVLGILIFWYAIRYALYGRPRRWVTNVP